MFYLELSKCFNSTNEFLHQYFKSYYKPPLKRITKSSYIKNNSSTEDWRQYSNDTYLSPHNYFDKVIPELENMNDRELSYEYNQVRKNIAERAKIIFLCKKSISNARISKNYSQVGLKTK